MACKMNACKDYLIELDQQNGDGDLGLSMSGGFSALSSYAESSCEKDLGKFLMQGANAFNEAAPSSLGTIISFCLMGMAKSLKGKEEAGLAELAAALEAGIGNIMDKAGSKRGEKTILDALIPGAEALKANAQEGCAKAAALAAKAAAEGSESTKEMLSVHGRAAYYGEKSLGVLDGGSVVGRLIFEAAQEYAETL